MEQGYNRLKKQRYAIISLFFIIALGAFLRTYNFHDWLRFNADQARDASVARTMVEKNDIPLLGPVAGGTEFRIGPISIYFQFLGAWLFGATPDRMAYADLLFGILSVPLIFLFFREYFSRNIALSSAALYAVSFFAIQYSRFAWNSNSSQFFVLLLLYAIIKIADKNDSKKLVWAVISGIALGVAIQLHTLLLFGVPLFFIIIAVHLVKNKRVNILHVAFIIAIAIVINLPQIINEINTEQGNTTAFYDALNKKTPKQATMGGNILHVVTCQAQANVRILLPQAGQESCGFPFTKDNLKKIDKKKTTFVFWVAYIVPFIFAVLFSIAGYYFMVYRAFKAKEERKRIFFAVIFAYCISLLLVSFPFGREISLRYFILTAFIPYLFMALFLEWLTRKHKMKKLILALLVVGLVFLYNIYFCVQTFRGYANNRPGNMIDGNMLQAQKMAEYLMAQAHPASSFQIGGKKTELGRFVGRISYFAEGKEMSVIEIEDRKYIDTELPLFVAVNEMSKKCEEGSSYKDYGIIEKCKRFNDVTILKMTQN